MIRNTALIALLSAFALSCGDKEGDTSSTDAGDDGADDSAIDCATDAWDIEQEQAWKITWMGQCFVGEIAAIIQAADDTRTISCGSCHGADLGGGDYGMPNHDFALDWNDTSDWDPLMYDATTFTGTMDDVSSAGATLLGLEPSSDENPTGFDCSSCHPS